MSKQIFRKTALERLSSPEELDSLMRVTTPKGWLALLSMGGLIAVAVLWGIYGSIPTKIGGQGILVKPGGVLDITSLTTGQVTATYVDVGGVVEKGQVVARVAQPKLMDEISHARAELKDLKTEFERASQYGSEEMKMQTEYLAKRRTELERSIQNGTEHLKWLNETLENRKRLLEQGLITKQTLIKTQEEISTTKQDIEKMRGDLKQNSIQEFQLKEQRERELIVRTQKINQQERTIAALEYDLEESSRVTSPYRGRILEITAMEGRPIDKGARLLTLERAEDGTNNLEAIIYVPATEGKKLRPGMKALVSPSLVKQEESGSVLAIVTHVSEFPATQQRMMRGLQNENLVRALSAGGSPIEVYADLVSDPNTQSGFKWSSGKGPPMKIQSGTLCMASITVEEQAPITMVIPLLKKHILGIGQEQFKGL